MNPGNPGLVSDNFLYVALFIALILVAVLAYVYSGKNLKVTVWLTAGIAGFIFLTQIFISWQQYLSSVFLSSTDASGAVVPVSRSGMGLLLDGWQVWLFPALLLVLIAAAITYQLTRRKGISQEIPSKPSEVKLSGDTSEMVTLQLEMETLRRDLTAVRSKFNKVQAERDRASERNVELQIRIKQLLNEIDELKRQS